MVAALAGSGVPSGRRLILVVDDDPKIVALVRAYLVRAGYQVETAGDGLAALRLIRELAPALVVLDLMLPRLDGMAMTRLVREESDVPILMLTARGGLADRVAGLGEGADDYLAKPFSPSELVARVQAILRRARPALPPLLELGDLVIDRERLEVRRADQVITLSLVEFRLLEALAGAQGRVLSRTRLLDAVSADLADGVLERSVDVYVSRLRRKLGDLSEEPRYVSTVRGAGYRVVGGPGR